MDEVTVCQLVANVTCQLVTHRIVIPETVVQGNLFSHLATLLKDVSKTLAVMLKDGPVGLGPVVEALLGLLDWRGCDRQVGGVMSALCRAATPAQLTDLLLDIAADKVSGYF